MTAADRHWYLFDVNPSTPPAFEVAPGEEFMADLRLRMEREAVTFEYF